MGLILLLVVFNDSLALFDCLPWHGPGGVLGQCNQRGDTVTLGTLPPRFS
jgi:hypothetical protein